MYTTSNIYSNSNSNNNNIILSPLQSFHSSFNHNLYNPPSQANVGGSIESSAEEEETQVVKPSSRPTMKRKSSPEDDENSEEKRKNFLERNRQGKFL